MEVTVTRLYLSEESHLWQEIFNHLQHKGMKGATVFRGIKGFGLSGKTRENTLLDMHFDLPIIIEFFDEHAKVEEALTPYLDKIEACKILQWTAEVRKC